MNMIHRGEGHRSLTLLLLFRALSDRTRLRLLNLLSMRPLCVCFLVRVIGTNQPKISRHLAYLRRAGVVQSTRAGKWVYYAATKHVDARIAALLTQILADLANDAQMIEDRKRLESLKSGNDVLLVDCAPLLQAAELLRKST